MTGTLKKEKEKEAGTWGTEGGAGVYIWGGAKKKK
jgi:hypothetical protein